MTDDERLAALRDQVGMYNPDALLADGFEEAFLGMAERCGQPALAVYDALRCIQILIERDGMSEDDAAEHLQFNTLGAWVGEMTPLFLWRYDREEL